MTEPTVSPTRYTVSCLPADHIDNSAFDVQVEYRGLGRWAVLMRSWCLNSDGGWDPEPLPSSRTDDWLAAHRFDLDTALRLAKEKAPRVTVNGHTIGDVLAARG